MLNLTSTTSVHYTVSHGYHTWLQVSKFDDPQEACLSVVAESYRLWLQHETRTDDITMVVIQFQGLEEETPQLALPTPMG